MSHKSALFACLLSAWWGGCWLAADAWYARRTDAAFKAETAKAERYVANTAQGFERIVAVRTGMPRHFARDADVLSTFARIGPVAAGADLPFEERQRRWSADPALAKLNNRFAQDATDLSLGAIGLLDTRGNTFALGIAPGDKNWLGVNYFDRDYFPDILAGRSGYRVIFGKQFGVAGIAFYAPVVENGRVQGAVIGRTDLRPFLNWLAPADAFLTDSNGVVVLASDSDLVGSATADAPVRQLDDAAKQVAYRHADLDLLDIASANDARYPELRRVPEREHPVIHRKQGIASSDEPTIHVFWPFPQRAEFTERRDLAFLILGAGGTALLLLALTQLAQRRERQEHLRSIAREVAALNESETRLRLSHKLLRALAARHDEQHEEERRQLAHKLHEDLAQNISSLRLYFVSLDDDARRADALAAMRQIVERALAIAREMATTLRPTVLDLGIAEALRWLAADFEKGLGLHLELDIPADIDLDDEIATFVFRAAQEILINVALHAAAHTVRLSFAADGDAYCLTIRDDGRGFDPAAPRAKNAFGLLRLAEQAQHFGGTLRIDAAPGMGTAVEIRLPAAYAPAQ